MILKMVMDLIRWGSELEHNKKNTTTLLESAGNKLNWKVGSLTTQKILLLTSVSIICCPMPVSSTIFQDSRISRSIITRQPTSLPFHNCNLFLITATH